MSEALKPCPFCGGRASAEGVMRWSSNPDAHWADGTEVLEAFYVNCLKCNGEVKGILGFQTREKAIAAWNERKPEKALVEALKAIADNEGESCRRCEGNGTLWADGKEHYPSENAPTRPCPDCSGAGRVYPDLQAIAEEALKAAGELNQ